MQGLGSACDSLRSHARVPPWGRGQSVCIFLLCLGRGVVNITIFGTPATVDGKKEILRHTRTRLDIQGVLCPRGKCSIPCLGYSRLPKGRMQLHPSTLGPSSFQSRSRSTRPFCPSYISRGVFFPRPQFLSSQPP